MNTNSAPCRLLVLKSGSYHIRCATKKKFIIMSLPKKNAMKSFSVTVKGISAEYQLVNLYVLHNFKIVNNLDLSEFLQTSKKTGIQNPQIRETVEWCIERIKEKFGCCDDDAIHNFFRERYTICPVVSMGKKRKNPEDSGGTILRFVNQIDVGQHVIYAEEKKNK